MRHLITVDEARSLGRPIGKVDSDKLTAYINEAEQLHVKPILGNRLYLRILAELEKPEDERDGQIRTLLDGGAYQGEACGCDDGTERCFDGLKVAIAYFVNAQNVMSGDFESTRYGMVVKDGEYSSHLTDRQRSENYGNIMGMANGFLMECVAYCKAVGLIKSPGKSKVTFGGVRIRKIG